jgi:hypothetical protein
MVCIYNSRSARQHAPDPVASPPSELRRDDNGLDIIDNAIITVIRNACLTQSPAPTTATIMDALPVSCSFAPESLPNRMKRLERHGAFVVERLSKYRRRFIMAGVGTTDITYNRGRGGFR